MPRTLVRPSLDASCYPFVHRVRTRFSETDAMGIVHHAAYALYFEDARVALLRHTGHPYDEVRQGGIDLSVVEMHVRYRRPTRFDEEVDIHVGLGGLTRTTFQAEYLATVGGEPRATAVTLHGAVDADGRPAKLPTWLGSIIASSTVDSGG